jgi:hypothetical protein
LDTAGEPVTIISCMTSAPDLARNLPVPANLDPDSALNARLKKKLRDSGSEVVFRHKRVNPKAFDNVNQMARECLREEGPVWEPSSVETRAAHQEETESALDKIVESAAETPLFTELKKSFPEADSFRHPHYGTHLHALRGKPGLLVPQLRVPTEDGESTYVCDFALFSGDTWLWVEVDGRTFHDRGPEQFVYERKRERELRRSGWRVERFAAREVLDDARSCALEILEVL